MASLSRGLGYGLAQGYERAAKRIYRERAFETDINHTTVCLHVCIEICAATVRSEEAGVERVSLK